MDGYNNNNVATHTHIQTKQNDKSQTLHKYYRLLPSFYIQQYTEAVRRMENYYVGQN